MSYIGDMVLGQTFDTKFCTVQSTGAPTTLSGSPVISNYVGNGTTEITAGITLTVDFDSRTGLNNVRVVATSGNTYAAQTDNQLVITTGTVNSVSAVGYVIAEYSIQNRFTNVAQINSVSTSAVTTIKAVQGLAVDGVVTTVTNQLTAAAIATGVWQDATAGDFTAANSVGKSVMNGVALGTGLTIAAVSGAVGSVTGAVGSVTGAVGSVTGAVGSVTGNVGGNVVGSVASVTGNVGGNVVGSTASVTAGVTVTTNNDKTGYALSATGSAALTEGYAADGATATMPQLLYMILAMLSEFSISGTTLTAKKLDGSTTAATFTLNDATSPTSITRAT